MRGTTLSTIAASLAGVLGVASPALAQPFEPNHVRLDYDRGGLEACADEGVFRAYVASQFAGQDPFTPDAPRRLAVKLRRQGGLYRAKLDMYDEAGKWLGDESGERIAYASCTRTVQHAGELVAAWLIPIVVLKPAAPPAPPPPPVCDAPLPLPPPATRFDLWPRELPLSPLRAPEPDPPKPPERAVAFRVGAGAWADYISDSGGSLGLTLDAGVRFGWFSVAGEGRWDPALGTTTYSIGAITGGFRFSRGTGALMACVHHSVLVGCLKGQGGQVWFRGSSPALPALPYAAAGVRVGLEFSAAPWFILRLDGELLPTIDPASEVIGKQAIFQIARLNAGLGLGGMFAMGKL